MGGVCPKFALSISSFTVIFPCSLLSFPQGLHQSPNQSPQSRQAFRCRADRPSISGSTGFRAYATTSAHRSSHTDSSFASGQAACAADVLIRRLQCSASVALQVSPFCSNSDIDLGCSRPGCSRRPLGSSSSAFSSSCTEVTDHAEHR